MSLENEIQQALDQSKGLNEDVSREYKERITKGKLTKDEDPISNFCAYFLPYNSTTQQVLFGHHKKSGKWLSPGGHTDKDESLLETLNREIEEELGVKSFFTERPAPFLLTITPIDRDPRKCREHFDVWHLMETDGKDFNIDMAEYREVRWLPISEAKEITTDAANQAALDFLTRTRF
ncbi:MAG TPA: NUDIX hydrolase [Candidatus Wunengus californicus]|uniref:NUDIX hydrolase n=1 Tax=Candidatus Wunengus californicus TaxID=3367619 RepID=UPI0040264B10